uniref:Anaphase-promoting complex subunit 4 WD40 domain-containing protein n=1 Tax=Oryza barthii TaxID=65489 RepID=A0A0D3FAB2_9ORYZ
MSLASQPSLRSLPSLDVHDLNTSPSLHQCIATIKGHSSASAYVSALAVDGDSLYIASSDGSIRLWALDGASRSQEEQQQDDGCSSSSSSTTVADTDSSVKSLLATGNGGLLLSSHQDGKIRAWRAAGGGTARHGRSSSWDRSIKVWRLPGFRCVESIAAAHDDAINALAVSPDGRVYTGSADKKIKAWTRGPGQRKHALVGTMERHRSAVNALALGANGKVLYSGACDRSVVVWESAGGGDGGMEATGTLRGHARAILCLAAAGELVCSGSADRTVRVWRRGGAENNGYTCLAVMESHGAAVKSLALVRGGRDDDGSCSSEGSSALVCSGALDGDVKIWSVFIPCL